MLYRDFPSRTEVPVDSDIREAAEGIWASSPSGDDAYITLDANVMQTPNVVRVYTDGVIAQATKKTVIKEATGDGDAKRILTQVITVPSFDYGYYGYPNDINLTTRVRKRYTPSGEDLEGFDENVPFTLAYAYQPVYVSDIRLNMNFRLGNSYVKSVPRIPGSTEKEISGGEDLLELVGLEREPWETLLSEAGIEGCTVKSERFGGRFDGYTKYTIEFPELKEGESEAGLIELRSSESFVSRFAADHMINGASGVGLDHALILPNWSIVGLMEDYQGLGTPVLTQEAGDSPFGGNPTPEYWLIPVKKKNKELGGMQPLITHGAITFSGPDEYVSKVKISYQCEEGSRSPRVTTTEVKLNDDGLGYQLVTETTGGESSDDAAGCVSQDPVITKSDLTSTIKQVHSNMVAKWKENKFLFSEYYYNANVLSVDRIVLGDPRAGYKTVVPGSSEDDPSQVTFSETFFYAHLPLNSPILKWDYVVHESETESYQEFFTYDYVPTNNHKLVTLDFSNVEPTTITFVAPDRSDDPNYEPDPDNPEPEPYVENVLFLDCDEAIDKSDSGNVWTGYFPGRVTFGDPTLEEEEPYIVSSGMYAYPSGAWANYSHPAGFGSMNDYMLPQNEVLGLGGRKLWPDELPKWHETTETFVIGEEEEGA